MELVDGVLALVTVQFSACRGSALAGGPPVVSVFSIDLQSVVAVERDDVVSSVVASPPPMFPPLSLDLSPWTLSNLGVMGIVTSPLDPPAVESCHLNEMSVVVDPRGSKSNVFDVPWLAARPSVFRRSWPPLGLTARRRIQAVLAPKTV